MDPKLIEEHQLYMKGFLASLPQPIEIIKDNYREPQAVRLSIKPPVPQRSEEPPQTTNKPIVKRKSKTSD